MDISEKNIQYLKGVGEKRARLFNKLGIFTVGALINFYPRSYLDLSKTTTVKNAPENENACIEATLISVVNEHKIRKGLTLYKCKFSDGESIIAVTIFNNKYLAESLRIYEEYILYGKLEKSLTSASMSSPKIEKLSDAKSIHPIYRATDKLNSKAIEKVIHQALSDADSLHETLPEEILKAYSLSSLDFSIREIHFPQSMENIEKARKRLAFEELLVLQLGLLMLKNSKSEKTDIVIKEDFSEEFYSLLPFTPTNAQKRATQECIKDMQSSKPMSRLLQGDVGSGKTAVAAGVIYSTVKSSYQCALMAPTEILASQHFETLSKLLGNSGIKTELLTGSTTLKEKREIKKRLSEGETDLIIGTHAIIQNDVEFKRLGLVITDEQHRFGVNQRAELAMKGTNPHTLVMSATPIPRTLAMIVYGELDISILDELPPNRQKIRTDVVDSSYHNRIYKFIRTACDNGKRAYIVCPLVDESEAASELTAAKEYAEKLSSGAFKGYSLALLHGKMKPKEKEEAMNAFARGDVQILVSTTVIEVGVDVPEATIMLVENAERFGLSQLHQLRGRVGRGSSQSYCILVSDSKSESAKERLATMKKYSDGFKIADVDLKLRGPGDFFGKRQHGLPELKIADMVNDMELLKATRKCAEDIVQNDRRLDKPEHKALVNEINKMFEESYFA